MLNVRFDLVTHRHTTVIQPSQIGVDEAGRGAWAGPVSAAAVLWPDALDLPGLSDSKVLSPARRQALAALIKCSCSYAVVFVGAEEIDRVNILQATLAAMSAAVASLPATSSPVFIDGNRTPSDLPSATAVVRGDSLMKSIMAASILAKTERDSFMAGQDTLFRGYGFSVHKGYGVPEHIRALSSLGPSPIHRLSYKPVRNWTDL